MSEKEFEVKYTYTTIFKISAKSKEEALEESEQLLFSEDSIFDLDNWEIEIKEVKE